MLFINLTYQGLTGDHTQNTLALSGNAIPFGLTSDDPAVIGIGDTYGINIGNLTVAGAELSQEPGHETEYVNGEGSAYVLLYLNENNDQSSEMGAEFKAQLTYTSTAGNGNQLTGTFTVSQGNGN